MFARVTAGDNGGATFWRLRYPGDLQQAAMFSVEMAIEVLRTYVHTCHPSQKIAFAEWYVKVVSDRLRKLTGPRLINLAP